MKRIRLKILISTVIIVLLSFGVAYAEDDMMIFWMKYKIISMENQQPIFKRSAMYVPLRFLENELGASVQWEDSKIIITKGDVTMTATVDSSIYTRDGEQFSVKEMPFLQEGTLYLPLRIIAEQLGYDVSYERKAHLTYSVQWKRLYPDYYIINIGIMPSVSSAPKPLPKDDSFYEPSYDKKWGLREEVIYTANIETLLYLKNFETQEIKVIYETPRALNEEVWTTDNRVLINGVKDPFGGPNRERLLLYDPITDEFQTLSEKKSWSYSPSLNSIIYYTHMQREQSDNTLLDLETMKIKVISPEQTMEYLKQGNEEREQKVFDDKDRIEEIGLEGIPLHWDMYVRSLIG